MAGLKSSGEVAWFGGNCGVLWLALRSRLVAPSLTPLRWCSLENPETNAGEEARQL